MLSDQRGTANPSARPGPTLLSPPDRLAFAACARKARQIRTLFFFRFGIVR
jgi:hypothetical protein